LIFKVAPLSLLQWPCDLWQLAQLAFWWITYPEMTLQANSDWLQSNQIVNASSILDIHASESRWTYSDITVLYLYLVSPLNIVVIIHSLSIFVHELWALQIVEDEDFSFKCVLFTHEINQLKKNLLPHRVILFSLPTPSLTRYENWLSEGWLT